MPKTAPIFRYFHFFRNLIGPGSEKEFIELPLARTATENLHNFPKQFVLRVFFSVYSIFLSQK